MATLGDAPHVVRQSLGGWFDLLNLFAVEHMVRRFVFAVLS